MYIRIMMTIMRVPSKILKLKIPTGQNPETQNPEIQNPDKFKIPTGSKSRQVKIPTGPKSRQVKIPTGPKSRQVKIPTGSKSTKLHFVIYLFSYSVNKHL